MRTAFLRALREAAATDDRVFLLVGDLGYSVIEPFAQEFPNRFLNVGVAEQNLAGVAAGLALSGKVVFTYSIGNFPTLRCLEHIRNDICYHQAAVKIVAVGGGMAYGSLGMTHHATEDLAIMRALPGMEVIAPGDPIETTLATRAIVTRPGPCYLRLGKAGEPVVHDEPPPFTVGKALTLSRGSDVTFVSTGGMLAATVQAAEQLGQTGLSVGVVSMPTIKPLDADCLRAVAGQCELIVTVEEHNVIGGLGSAVSEVLVGVHGSQVGLKKVGVQDRFYEEIGSQEYLRAQTGLTVEQLVNAAETSLAERRSTNGQPEKPIRKQRESVTRGKA